MSVACRLCHRTIERPDDDAVRVSHPQKGVYFAHAWCLSGDPAPATDGDYIETWSGVRFNIVEPHHANLNVYDIAHALSLTNRFAGHTRFPYSVAQHSYLMARGLFAEGFTEEWSVLGWCLFHDAAEAYMGDVPRPVKARVPGFAVLEDEILRQVAIRFKLPPKIPEVVKIADRRMCVTEAGVVLRENSSRTWPEEQGVVPFYQVPIHEIDWQEAQDRWVECLDDAMERCGIPTEAIYGDG